MNYLLFLVVVFAGAALSIQASVNAELRMHLGHAIPTALVSFAVGLAGLVIVALATGSFLPSGSIKEVPWWGWIGGLLGAFFMTVSAYSVRNLGTTFFFAVIIASQLAMALLIDHYGLFGQIKNEITVIRAIGFSMLIAGNLLIKI